MNPNGTAASQTGRESFEKMLQSIFVESTEAEAILFLANYFLKNREYNVASACCSRLLDYAGPEREQAKALQREIRTRLTMGGRSLNRTFLSRSQVPNDSFEFSP
jgi:anaphase-promoting complex subunit 8